MRTDRLPPRVLPWLYFGSAWISLAMAFAALIWDPRGAAGFFYHARLAGIVHLVTLGWITMSILGALYVAGPVALRMPMPARRIDWFAFALAAIGIVGMVAHFWIAEFGGLAWSGLMVTAGILLVGGRVVRQLRHAPIHGAVKLHLRLAFANIAAAATAGVLLGFDKVYHFLPGFVLSNVVAHAHLAAIGWVSMMVVGIAYRMLPMLLPARPPQGRTMYASAILLQTGATGLFVTLILQSGWVTLFAAATIAGFAAFITHVALMLMRRGRPHAKLPARDYAIRHAFLALGFLGIAAAVGMILAVADMSETTLRLALAYGVFGLVGFLAQMVAGLQLRLLPLLAWFTAARGAADRASLGSPHAFTSTQLAAVSFILWLWGVPALAVGFAVDATPLLSAGALALEAAVVIGAIQALRAVRYAFSARRRSAGLVILRQTDAAFQCERMAEIRTSRRFCRTPRRAGVDARPFRLPLRIVEDGNSLADSKTAKCGMTSHHRSLASIAIFGVMAFASVSLLGSAAPQQVRGTPGWRSRGPHARASARSGRDAGRSVHTVRIAVDSWCEEARRRATARADAAP
jgi:hypothetical protein